MAARGGSTSIEAARPAAPPSPPRADTPPPFIPTTPDHRVQDSGAHLGLQAWRSPTRRGTIFHADAGGHRVTAGHPQGASADLGVIHEEFREGCRRDGLKPLHFAVTASAREFLPEATARSCWHVGDLPVFDPARWRNDRLLPRAIRAQILRARNHGVVVTHWPAPPRDSSRLTSLRRARDAWIAMKPLPPLVFMTTPYVFDPWPQEGVFIAEAHGEIVGFLVASRALFGDLYRVDVVARVPGAPNGTAELLVREAFFRAAQQGIAKASLGLAPLSRRSGVATDRLGWGWVASGLARRCGNSLYSFAGLEAFKAKFAPEAWVPLYCVAPGRRLGFRDVLAVARVFAGGSLIRYTWRAVVRAFT